MRDLVTVKKIEGQTVAVVERTPPLPRKLSSLLSALTDVAVRNDIRPAGATRSCDARIHAFGTLAQGRYTGPDRVLRDLRIQMCRDCGAACVRDISFDVLDGVPIGSTGARRRDLVLGWYTGGRPAGRQYS